MLIAIIGSRGLIVDISKYIPRGVTKIVSGGAKGIDTLAEEYADKNNISMQIIKPEYVKHKKAAPLKRNEIIVNVSDLIIVIWDGESRGTKYVIDYAKKVGKPVEVYIVSRE